MVVEDGPATAMGHDDETLARPNVARRPYRVWIASNAGVVVWWDHEGTTTVVNERHSASWVSATVTAVSSH